jgi:hypothetical protein
LVERQIDDPSNVLANDPTGSSFVDDSKHFWPEVTVILVASLLPGKTEWLAREATGEEVEIFDFVSVKVSDVIVDFWIFEILFYHRLAKLIVIAKTNVLVLAAPHPLRREGEATNP